jgi:aspartyl-tRNA(Asn)/glutamyl-tRNA(Gln) amidotransferase subunit A
MLSVIAQPDIRDIYSIQTGFVDHRSQIDDGIRGWRIGFSDTLGGTATEAEVAAIVRAALPAFVEAGATIEEVGDVFPSPREAFENLYWASQGARLSDFTPEQQAVMDPGQVAFARRGQAVSARELFQAGIVRDELSRRMAVFHQTYDLLVTPQVSIRPFEAGANWPSGSGMTNWFDWAGFLYPFNFTRQPAASFPCGFTEDGLPVGLQIVAKFGADEKVLRAARALERGRPIAVPNAGNMARNVPSA